MRRRIRPRGTMRIGPVHRPTQFKRAVTERAGKPVRSRGKPWARVGPPVRTKPIAGKRALAQFKRAPTKRAGKPTRKLYPQPTMRYVGPVKAKRTAGKRRLRRSTRTRGRRKLR